MIIADTDVLIDFQRDRAPGASMVAAELQAGSLATTVVTVFELLSGARTEKQKLSCHRLLEAITAFPLDEASAAHAAEIRRELDSAGTALAPADCLIAGICRHRSLPLLTRNRRHFDRVPGLLLIELS